MTGLAQEPDSPTRATEPGGSAEPPRRVADPERRRAALVDVAVAAGLLLGAVVVNHGLLASPSTRVLSLNVSDQDLFEWYLARGTQAFGRDAGLLSHLVNAPEGINLMCNTSIVLLGMLFAPVTVLFGAPVSFALVMTLNFAATGFAWYLLMSRSLGLHRAAAATGGAVAAFAPGMVSHGNAHPNLTAQWLIPVIVWCVLRLARTGWSDLPPGRWTRRVAGTGLLLAAVICAQLFIGEEVLFLAAVALGLFCVMYAVCAPRRALAALPALATGVIVAAGVATVILAYPLWMQFAGPQHVPNGPFSASYFSGDVAALTTFSPLTLAGNPAGDRLTSGASEYNSFLGLPILLVFSAAAAWLWRRPAVPAIVVTAVVMLSLSWGPQLVVNGTRTVHNGPYQLIASLPVVGSALPSRFALTLIPLIGLVVAMALDRALRSGGELPRFVVPIVLAAALLPMLPVPLPTAERAPVPKFFTEGYWRSCVKPGGTLVPVPPPDSGQPDRMRWASAADAAFAIPEGYFIGPYAEGGNASVGIYSRPTAAILKDVEESGTIPRLSQDDVGRAREDVAYWHTTCLVLGHHGQPHVQELRQTMDALFGPGRDVADVTVWRVTPS